MAKSKVKTIPVIEPPKMPSPFSKGKSFGPNLKSDEHGKAVSATIPQRFVTQHKGGN